MYISLCVAVKIGCVVGVPCDQPLPADPIFCSPVRFVGGSSGASETKGFVPTTARDIMAGDSSR